MSAPTFDRPLTRDEREYITLPTVFGPLDRVDQLERDEATGKVRECGWCSTFTRGERHDCPNAPEGTQR